MATIVALADVYTICGFRTALLPDPEYQAFYFEYLAFYEYIILLTLVLAQRTPGTLLRDTTETIESCFSLVRERLLQEALSSPWELACPTYTKYFCE